MWRQIVRNLPIILSKINRVYPQLLGVRFWLYKNRYLKNNYTRFNVEHKLLDIVNRGIKNVPYYNNKYQPLSSISEFKKQVGFIDKDLVMNNWNDFQQIDYSKNQVISGTTGGTSGKPLRLIIPKNRYVFELGTMYTMWGKAGWKGHTRAVLRNANLKNNIDFKVNPIKKEIIFDGFRTSDLYYDTIYQTMKRYNIKFLHAYPSSAYQFCVYIKREKLETSIFRAFFWGLKVC